MTLSAVGADVELDGVGVQLGDRWVLSGIDVRVRPGEVLGVAGPSGAGKTVLCAVLGGIVPPTRGSVRYGGAAMDEARPNVGVILQNHGLLSGLTSAENVAFPLQARGIERETAAERVAAALAAVGLGEQKDRPVDELSGGQRQRVGVARALAGDPAILVADEPTAELDPDNRGRVLELLLAHAARGNVVVIASDDPDVIDACDRVVHLHEGVVVRTTGRTVSGTAASSAGAGAQSADAPDATAGGGSDELPTSPEDGSASLASSVTNLARRKRVRVRVVIGLAIAFVGCAVPRRSAYRRRRPDLTPGEGRDGAR